MTRHGKATKPAGKKNGFADIREGIEHAFASAGGIPWDKPRWNDRNAKRGAWSLSLCLKPRARASEGEEWAMVCLSGKTTADREVTIEVRIGREEASKPDEVRCTVGIETWRAVSTPPPAVRAFITAWRLDPAEAEGKICSVPESIKAIHELAVAFLRLPDDDAPAL